MKKFDKHKALKKLDNKHNNNKTKKITVVISVIILVLAILYFSFARFESQETYSLINGTVKHRLIDYIQSLNTIDLEYDGVDTLGEYGTPDNNLRYVGADPSNYIYFNCSTSELSQMNDETCEKWRIVGIFNNIEDENGNIASRVKIIRDKPLGNYSWDSSDSTVNLGYGVSQWGESTYQDGTPYEGADLMRELNNDYLGNVVVGTDGKWYNFFSNSKSSMPTSSIGDIGNSMISKVIWKTGALTSNIDVKPKTVYTSEREDTPSKTCDVSKDTCSDTVNRTTSWLGKVALVYSSDHLYSTSNDASNRKLMCLNSTISQWSYDSIPTCKENTWMANNTTSAPFFWTLTTYANDNGAKDIMCINPGGGISNGDAFLSYNIKPAVYIDTNVMMAGGDGSSSNPYKLTI